MRTYARARGCPAAVPALAVAVLLLFAPSAAVAAGPPQLVVNSFGFDAGGWRVDQHPRFSPIRRQQPPRHRRLRQRRRVGVAQQRRRDVRATAVGGDELRLQRGRLARRSASAVRGGRGRHGRADIVGFGNDGVWVARNNGDGTFGAPQLVVNSFGYQRGRLARRSASAVRRRRRRRRPRRHRRLRQRRRVGLAQQRRRHVRATAAGGDELRLQCRRLAGRSASAVRGGRASATAAPTSSASATTACGSRAATATGRSAPQLVVDSFGFNAGGWRVDQHPRFVADLVGNGRADIVGFGNDGVWVSRNNGDGTFGPPQLVVTNFGFNAGGWRVDQHPRFLANRPVTAAPTSSASATTACGSRRTTATGGSGHRSWW